MSARRLGALVATVAVFANAVAGGDIFWPSVMLGIMWKLKP